MLLAVGAVGGSAGVVECVVDVVHGLM